MNQDERRFDFHGLGAPLKRAREWLGHADISTTLIYAHADTEMKRKAMEEATGNYFPKVSAEK